MFCPSCGSEERQASQYCRACGTDLRPVRQSLERPDSITLSAVSAREEIGRAVAARIREVQDADELKKVAEDVLPEIEKFLESPDAKRLRRMRAGVIVASIGVGFTILMLLMANFARLADLEGLAGGAGLGIVTFCIGLGLLINAFLFTRPRTNVADKSAAAQSQKMIDSGYQPPVFGAADAPSFKAQTTSNLVPNPGTVTEQTTKHLKI